MLALVFMTHVQQPLPHALGLHVLPSIDKLKKAEAQILKSPINYKRILQNLANANYSCYFLPRGMN